MSVKEDPEDTCYCRCGNIFRSHVRSEYVGITYRTITNKKCSQCGKDSDCWKISSDPEIIEFKKEA